MPSFRLRVPGGRPPGHRRSQRSAAAFRLGPYGFVPVALAALLLLEAGCPEPRARLPGPHGAPRAARRCRRRRAGEEALRRARRRGAEVTAPVIAARMNMNGNARQVRRGRGPRGCAAMGPGAGWAPGWARAPPGVCLMLGRPARVIKARSWGPRRFGVWGNSGG